jgi:signal transduction histidine kinase
VTRPRVHDVEGIRELLQAVAAISSDVELPVVLRHTLEAAVEVIGAAGGALGLLADGGDDVSELISVGMARDQVDAIAARSESYGMLGGRSFLRTAMQGRDRLLGHLYLTHEQTDTEFSAEDAGLAAGFAGAAAIAIDNAELRVRLRAFTLMEDRERIAVDLHDTVTQRLFAISLSLQGTVKAISAPEVAERVTTAVDDLDQTIRQVRSTIFASYDDGPIRGDHYL